MERLQRRMTTVTNSSMAVTVALIVFTFLVIMLTSFNGVGSRLRLFNPASSNGSSKLLSHFSTAVQLQSVSVTSSPPFFAGNASTDRNRLTSRGREHEMKRKENGSEEGLAKARAAIRTAVADWNRRNKSSNFFGSSAASFIYRNPRAFYQSYIEMERRLKVYIYNEGDLPIVHDGPCKDIYSIEGRFIHEIEHNAKRFKTKNPNHAHLFFMPFSVTWMVKYLYKPMTYNLTPLRHFVSDYVHVISTKYPFWNRTQGADHFMLSCHDWGPLASKSNLELYNNSIRVLCNANSSEGFNPQKDVSLPEIHLYDGRISPKLLPSPHPTGPRPYLAFFAGGLHGPIRPTLLEHWRDRDPQLQVHEYLPKNLDYYTFMLQSKFCLCPSGYEVASPRIVEAIYAECVPVILSKNYVLPFSDVLRWDAFSIQLDVEEIPRLKEILGAVSEDKYKRLIQGIRIVRRHFSLNKPAKRFDVFHMILHSVWLRRLNLKLS